MKRIKKTASGCWLWQAHKSTDGYGKRWHQGKLRSVHRILYEHKFGPIPTSLELDHLCRQRACCNPDHLEAVTHRENVRRGHLGVVTAARQLNKTHCKKGHPYNAENTYIDPKKYGPQKSPSRHCKICKLATHKKWRERQKNGSS